MSSQYPPSPELEVCVQTLLPLLTLRFWVYVFLGLLLRKTEITVVISQVVVRIIETGYRTTYPLSLYCLCCRDYSVTTLKKTTSRDFPDSPVVKTLCRDVGWIPGLETKIPHAIKPKRFFKKDHILSPCSCDLVWACSSLTWWEL